MTSSNSQNDKNPQDRNNISGPPPPREIPLERTLKESGTTVPKKGRKPRKK